MGQVLSTQEIQSELSGIRKNKKIVFTNGCFDILHAGHIHYLQEAKAQGDLLVLGLNSDSSVRKLKGDDRPIQNENDRAKILSALAAIDYVVIFNEDTPEELIKKIKPDVLVKGGDWKPEQIAGGTFVKSYGGTVKSLSFVNSLSTSKIVEKIKHL